MGDVAQVSSKESKRAGLGCSIALAVLLLGAIAGGAVGVPRLLSVLNDPSAAPASAEADSFEALAALRESAQARLSSYGWVDQEAGLVHIPIDRAMALVADIGLPVGSPDTGSATDAPAAPDGESGESAANGAAIDFEQDVLPIFMEYCAECHGEDDPEEGLVLTSYDAVMAGSVYGAVVVPGDAAGSYLVELVETGQMPKRGDDLSQAEIDTIVAWVNAGAQEQATAPSGTATLPEPTGDDAGETAAQPDAVNPETVSFQEHVLPIFMEYCAECHGEDDPEEGLVLTSHADVMAGSVYGSVIEPNDPAGSYLVDQVETGQMPKRGDDLSQVEIDTIVAWVNAGAPDN